MKVVSDVSLDGLVRQRKKAEMHGRSLPGQMKGEPI